MRSIRAAMPLVIEAAETLRGLEAELPNPLRWALQDRAGIDSCARVKLGKRAEHALGATLGTR